MNRIREKTIQDLPPIPDKRFFQIRQAAELCGVEPHVLRYWEMEFPKLKPNKRENGRRYYKQQHIELIRRIRELLYQKGYTIAGARQQLKNGALVKSDSIVTPEDEVVKAAPVEAVKSVEIEPALPQFESQNLQPAILSQIITELESLVGAAEISS